jgi:hypothetical protein
LFPIPIEEIQFANGNWAQESWYNLIEHMKNIKYTKVL